MIRIGVDTGGTFTDVVCYDRETDEVTVTKTPSTPPRFDEGVLNGVDKVRDIVGFDPGDVSYLSHGTTVGTNAVLENELPELGLITNEGLRDVLEIGDQTRPSLYDLQVEKPPSLVPRRLRRGVPGRLDSRGNEVDPLDEAAVRAEIDALVDEGVESIVVSMLFSYLDERQEQRVGELIEAHDEDVSYALSSSIHPEIREYDRTITTVLNEAVKTTVEEYFTRLDAGIAARGIDVPLNVMHSGGGIFSPDQAVEYAIRTVVSGPSAGAIAAREVTRSEGFENAIGIDMGGTSADVSIVRDGEIVRSTESEINDLPVKTPMIDINTVGAGGGSIAWLDEGGALRVGPESSGADPGPICYGRGGERPTVTDANLLLGRINPAYFLDGEMDLAVERTRELFTAEIADPLGLSVEAAAQSVIDVANASLAREIRRVTVERGQSPGEFVLVAFGGAGPLQAPAIAADMNMGATVIPRNPGVFSARGLLLADIRMDESRAYRAERLDATPLARQFDELEAALLDRFADQSATPDEVRVTRQIDMRYEGQSYEITVPIDAPVDGASLDAAIERFHEEHARLYGHARREEPVAAVTLRASGQVPTPPLVDQPAATETDASKGTREVHFDGEVHETDIYDRTALSPGQIAEGPAVLEEPGSTSLVPVGTTATVTDHGNVRIELTD
ncbi:MAG: hydantoinase/oxoprolinase family protein [Halobacteriales archaeon]